MKKKKTTMKITSSVKANGGNQTRTDFWYLEPILCPPLSGVSTSAGHYLLAPHPLRGGTGETPAEGLISGCKAGPADLSVELTQEQRDSDREEENAFIPALIDSFSHLLIQKVVATFLPQGGYCVQLKRGHSFTRPSNTRILLHPFFRLPSHLERKAENRSTPLLHKWGNGCLDGALDWQNFSLKPYHRSERAPSGFLKTI